MTRKRVAYVSASLVALTIVCLTILEYQRRSLAAEERERELRIQEEQVRPRKLWERGR